MTEGFFEFLRDLLTGGVGAFLGAWFAFKLENRRQEREGREETLSALRRAQFTLNRQYTQLQYLEGKLAPLEADPERWRLLAPQIGLSPQNRLDLSSLHFLLDSRASRLLDELAFCDDHYGLVLEVLETRNRTASELSAKVEALRSSSRPMPNHAAIDDAVGLDLKGRLSSLTDGLYGSVHKAISLNESLFARLSDHLCSTFPVERPIGREFIPITQETRGGKTSNTGTQADG
jgi:hypothetical protein